MLGGERVGLAKYIDALKRSDCGEQGTTLIDDSEVEVIELEKDTKESEAIRLLLNRELAAESSYPQKEQLNQEEFEKYYLSHGEFIIRFQIVFHKYLEQISQKLLLKYC